MARTKITQDTLTAMKDELIGSVRTALAQDPDDIRVFNGERKLQAYQRLRIELLTYVEHFRKENK